MPSFSLRLKTNELKTFARPAVMGIINVSPNSFFNACIDHTAALRMAEQMVHEGADFLDVGGEGTNPSVNIDREAPVVQEELDRVIPVIEKIKKHFDVLVSVDTRNPIVMEEAIKANVDMINDQRALKAQGAVELCAQHHMPVCIMHFPDPPRAPDATSAQALYELIIRESLDDAKRCEEGGISRDRIVLDPGFGGGNFGKSAAENFYILQHLERYCELGYVVLSGWSRKSPLGAVLNNNADERLAGSLTAAVISMMKGAHIIRVHDVKPTVEAAQVFQAVYSLE